MPRNLEASYSYLVPLLRRSTWLRRGREGGMVAKMASVSMDRKDITIYIMTPFLVGVMV